MREHPRLGPTVMTNPKPTKPKPRPDPFRLHNLAGADKFPADFNKKMEGWKKDGTTMKAGRLEVLWSAGLTRCLQVVQLALALASS